MTGAPSDARDHLLAELSGEGDYGVLLVAQMGGTPNELQLIIETAQYDEAVQGLRPQGAYIVRALGVREHQAHLGVFGRLQFLDEHPLLLHHNTPKCAVHFDGRAADLNALTLELFEAYVGTFGPWRNLAAMPDDFNPAQPLTQLLAGGFGLLGVMPKPLAERMVKALTQHGVKATISEQADFATTDEHGRSRLLKLLRIDSGYVIALDFSVERMNRKP